jgi:hypothetical protein
LKVFKIKDMKTNSESKDGGKDQSEGTTSKAGKYATFNAIAAIVVLSPMEAQGDGSTPVSRG